MAHLAEREGAPVDGLAGILRLNNDDFILKTCELWVDRLVAAGKQYHSVMVITEDSGMLAKAKHDGKVSALRVRELPTSQEGLKELIFDKELLSSLPSVSNQLRQPDAAEVAGASFCSYLTAN